MTGVIAADAARAAICALPEGTRHVEDPTPEHVYLPRSHLKALDPNCLVVTGMRGAGKTFWWNALQKPGVRRLLARQDQRRGGANARTSASGLVSDRRRISTPARTC